MGVPRSGKTPHVVSYNPKKMMHWDIEAMGGGRTRHLVPYILRKVMGSSKVRVIDYRANPEAEPGGSA